MTVRNSRRANAVDGRDAEVVDPAEQGVEAGEQPLFAARSPLNPAFDGRYLIELQEQSPRKAMEATGA